MIRYTETLEHLTIDHVSEGFFVGWGTPPTPAVFLRILQGSDHVILALDSDQVIGFITAITDGVLSAYIPLLEVLPAYKGQGIGSELVRRMLEKLNHLYMIDLICDADLQPFYERFGMIRFTGMIKRNYDILKRLS